MSIYNIAKAFFREKQSTISLFLAFFVIGSVFIATPYVIIHSLSSVSEEIVKNNSPYIWLELVRLTQNTDVFNVRETPQILLEEYLGYNFSQIGSRTYQKMLSPISYSYRSQNITLFKEERLEDIFGALKDKSVDFTFIEVGAISRIYLLYDNDVMVVILPIDLLVLSESVAKEIFSDFSSVNPGEGKIIYFTRATPYYYDTVGYVYPKNEVLEKILSGDVNTANILKERVKEFCNDSGIFDYYEVLTTDILKDEFLEVPLFITIHLKEYDKINSLKFELESLLLSNLTIAPSPTQKMVITDVSETIDLDARNLIQKLIRGDLTALTRTYEYSLFEGALILDDADYNTLIHILQSNGSIENYGTALGDIFDSYLISVSFNPEQYIFLNINAKRVAYESYNTETFENNLKSQILDIKNKVIEILKSYLTTNPEISIIEVTKEYGIKKFSNELENGSNTTRVPKSIEIELPNQKMLLSRGDYIFVHLEDADQVSKAVYQYKTVFVTSNINSALSTVYYGIIIILIVLAVSISILENIIERSRLWIATLLSRGLSIEKSTKILNFYVMTLAIIGVSLGIATSIVLIPVMLGGRITLMISNFLGSRWNYSMIIAPYIIAIISSYFTIRKIKKAMEEINVIKLKSRETKLRFSDFTVSTFTYIILLVSLTGITIHGLRITPEDVLRRVNNMAFAVIFIIIYAVSTIFLFISPFIVPSILSKVMIKLLGPFMNKLQEVIKYLKNPLWYIGSSSARKIVLESKTTLYVLSLVSSYIVGLGIFNSGFEGAIENLVNIGGTSGNTTPLNALVFITVYQTTSIAVMIIAFIIGLLAILSYINWFLLEIREEIIVLRARGAKTSQILRTIYGSYLLVYVGVIIISAIVGTVLYVSLDGSVFSMISMVINVRSVPTLNKFTYIVISYFATLFVIPLLPLGSILKENISTAIRRVYT